MFIVGRNKGKRYSNLKMRDITKTRDVDFIRCYEKVVSEIGFQARYMLKSELIIRTNNSTAPRFYTSETRALRVIHAMDAGVKIKDLRSPLRLKMYKEIRRRFYLLKNSEEFRGVSNRRLAYLVVNSEAPCFYLTNRSAIVIYESIINSL